MHTTQVASRSVGSPLLALGSHIPIAAGAVSSGCHGTGCETEGLLGIKYDGPLRILHSMGAKRPDAGWEGRSR